MSKSRWGLMVAAAVGCSSFTTLGWTQSASTSVPSSDSGALEEVIVSARKTNENIEDVPLAIRSFDAVALQRTGQVGLLDVAQLTPGFLFETFSSTFDSSPTIRGLAQFDVTTPQANTPTFIDGVYVPRDYSIDLGLADVSRIEIVKGPQSALYGANAFAGLLSYTLSPPPTRPEANVMLSAGNAGLVETKFSVGDSWLDDRVAARANYASSKYDGTWGNNYPDGIYRKNLDLGAHDNETYGGQIRLKPIDKLQIDLDYFHLDRHETIKPTYNVVQAASPFSNDPEVKYNCGLLICGTLSTNPLAYASATSTRLPGIVQPDLPGFTSGTNFYSARFRYDLTDELHLNYVYGWVGSYATEITDPSDDPVTPSFGINLSALATGQFVLGNFVSIQKEGGQNQLGSHEVRLEWDHGPLKALGGFYSSHDTDRYEFALGSVAPLANVTGTAPTPTVQFRRLSVRTRGEDAGHRYDRRIRPGELRLVRCAGQSCGRGAPQQGRFDPDLHRRTDRDLQRHHAAIYRELQVSRAKPALTYRLLRASKMADSIPQPRAATHYRSPSRPSRLKRTGPTSSEPRVRC